MRVVLIEALKADKDVPVGCGLVSPEGKVVFTSYNSREGEKKLLGHAELNVLAATWGSSSFGTLEGYSLVTTLEPCPMCAGAIRETGIDRVVFGAFNPQSGAAGSIYDVLRDYRLGKQIEVVSGVLEKECQELLDDFFNCIRNQSK